jgi:hypothetical protein
MMGLRNTQKRFFSVTWIACPTGMEPFCNNAMCLFIAFIASAPLSLARTPHSVARRSVRFMSPLSRKWRSGGGGRALSPDVSASLAMSICHVLIIVLFCDLIAYQDGVRSLVSTTTFADRNLHVYIKPSENRSIGGRGGGDARKSLHRTTIAPLEGVKGGEGGGMCALNEPCASFSIFLCCNAQRLCIEQFPGTCPTNAKFHFCIFLYSWGWD